MKKKTLTFLGVGFALVFGTAETCEAGPARAPSAGKVTQIVPEARACYDQTEKTVLLEFTPAGTDANGAPWPKKVICILPEQAEKYTVGSNYP